MAQPAFRKSANKMKKIKTQATPEAPARALDPPTRMTWIAYFSVTRPSVTQIANMHV